MSSFELVLPNDKCCLLLAPKRSRLAIFEKPVMCKRVEGRQQTGMRGGGGGGGGGGAAAALVRRLSLVAGWRQKQTGGQPSEAAASEAGLEGSEHKVFHIKRDSFFSLRAVQTLQVGI